MPKRMTALRRQPPFRPALGLALLLLAACATVPKGEPLPRHTDFLGRLIVIDRHDRWQAMLDWHAEAPGKGRIRITHAATSRVVELRWQGRQIWLRDNRAPSPAWRRIGPEKLAKHGIPLQPLDLAAFLLGDVPKGFTQIGPRRWRGDRGDSHLHVQWQGQRLTIDDAAHGRKAVLIILREQGHG